MAYKYKIDVFKIVNQIHDCRSRFQNCQYQKDKHIYTFKISSDANVFK